MAKANKQTAALLEDDAAAAERMAKEIKGKVSQEPAKDDEGHVEIDLDDEEEDDGEPEVARENASARRRNRYKEEQEARQRAEERAEQETAARRRAEEEAHRLRTQGPQPAPDVRQQIDAEHKRLYGIKRNLFNQMRLEERAAGEAGLSEERIAHFDEQARQLAWAENRLAAFALQQEDQPRQAQQMREHYIRTTYPDIVAKPEAVQYGIAMFNALVAEGWDANSNATLEEAAKRTRDNPKFGLKKAPKADAATTARLGGVPRGGPSNSAPQVASNKIRLNKHEQRMAREIYPDDSVEVAYRKHAKRLQKRASKKSQAEAE